MKIIAQKQKKKEWLVVCINPRCIFYNSVLIDKYIKLYNNGLNEKLIFNSLRPIYPIKSRAEIRAIEEGLLEQERILKRDPTKIKLLTYETKLK